MMIIAIFPLMMTMSTMIINMLPRDEILAVPVARCGVAASCSACVQLQVKRRIIIIASSCNHCHHHHHHIIITIIIAASCSACVQLQVNRRIIHQSIFIVVIICSSSHLLVNIIDILVMFTPCICYRTPIVGGI